MKQVYEQLKREVSDLHRRTPDPVTAGTVVAAYSGGTTEVEVVLLKPEEPPRYRYSVAKLIAVVEAHKTSLVFTEDLAKAQLREALVTAMRHVDEHDDLRRILNDNPIMAVGTGGTTGGFHVDIRVVSTTEDYTNSPIYQMYRDGPSRRHRLVVLDAKLAELQGINTPEVELTSAEAAHYLVY